MAMVLASRFPVSGSAEARFHRRNCVPRLLVVETSQRGDHSISRAITARFVRDWQAAHLGGEVIRRDLAVTALPFVDAPWLEAYLTPPEQQSPTMQ